MTATCPASTATPFLATMRPEPTTFRYKQSPQQQTTTTADHHRWQTRACPTLPSTSAKWARAGGTRPSGPTPGSPSHVRLSFPPSLVS
jgi:hypothetical protein